MNTAHVCKRLDKSNLKPNWLRVLSGLDSKESTESGWVRLDKISEITIQSKSGSTNFNVVVALENGHSYIFMKTMGSKACEETVAEIIEAIDANTNI